MVINKKTSYILIFLIVSQLFSCKPTRLIESGDYLLQKNQINIDNKLIDKKELESYYRQQPNKRFLLVLKFNLATYNFSKLGKERKWKSWLRRVIGEEPVVYDSVLVKNTQKQFVKFLKNEAYYNAKVDYNVDFSNDRAWVIYSIKTSTPVTIRNVNYEIEDSVLSSIVLLDTSKSFLHTGNRMVVAALVNERNRIVTQLRDSGYFEFSPDYIRFKVDTFCQQANITMVVRQAVSQDSLNNLIERPHKKYWINKVFFLPDFDPQKAIKERESYFNTYDTTYYNGYGFIYPGKVNVKPKTILKANTIFQGDIFNYSKVNGTTQYLNSLRIFRLNNISYFSEPESDSLINCVVQLTPSVYQSYSVNFETTTTQGNLGVGGYLNYKNKNIFKGAEIFNVKVFGSFQRQTATEDYDAFNIVEYGAETSLETPSFILPFKLERFYKKYNPKTNFSLLYSFQQRPDYKRSIYSASMGYNWKATNTLRHVFIPIDISSVDVDGKPEFMESIKDTYLENSYEDFLIAGGNYSLIYQNNKKKTFGSYSYYRLNVGTAGNILNFFHNTLGTQDTVPGGYYEMLNLQYSQYVLSDIDYRYSYFVNKYSSVVMRGFAGFAYPYGNSSAIPFIKQFYAGGAEGIRAWHPKDLGPGTYSIPDSIDKTYPNQTSDIKLEFNVEYRFSINRSWKTALFVDVGNIWSISDEDTRPGAVFKLNSFYKQFAIGTGFGIRYDLNFAVFRIDWGVKVRDPSIIGSDSWVLFNNKFDYKNSFIWHFAVGYPF